MPDIQVIKIIEQGPQGAPGLKGDRGDAGPIDTSYTDAQIAALKDGVAAERNTLNKLSGAIDSTALATVSEMDARAFSVAAAAPLQMIAHRGLPTLEPENTMAAFTVCHALGVRQIECDLHLTRDGVPVVIHDYRLERTTNGCGGVGDFTLDRLRQLSAALPCERGRTARFSDRYPYDDDGRPTCVIPTWSELLGYTVGRFDRLWAEIKVDDPAWSRERVHALVDDLIARRLEHLVVIQSFNLDHLIWVRERSMRIAVEMTAPSPAPDVPIEDIPTEEPPIAPELVPPFVDTVARALIAPTAALGGERYLLIDWRSAIGDATLVRAIRAAGVDVVVATITSNSATSARIAEALRQAGVSKIMSNVWQEWQS